MQRTIRELAGGFEHSDLPLLLAVGTMLFFGILVVYGTGAYLDNVEMLAFGRYHMVLKHLGMVAAGIVLMLVTMHMDYRWWRHRGLSQTALVVAMVLVGITLLIVRERNGVELPNRWLSVFGFSFQPSELAKLAVIMFLADRLAAANRSVRPPLKHVLIVLAVGPGLLAALLLLQPNYGNVMVMTAITMVILFVTGAYDRWLLRFTGAVPFLVAAAYFASDKIRIRIDHMVSGLLGGSFGEHVDQSLIGIGANSWTGVGVGQSHNKFAFLPEAHTDFIFSVLSEEWGMFGSLVIIGALVLFAWRGFGIAARASDPFGRAVAAGLTTGIVIYGLVNLAMVLGLFPVVGVPLPFVSYGGTAMLTSLAAVGILLNIDRGSRSYNVWKRRWDRGGTA